MALVLGYLVWVWGLGGWFWCRGIVSLVFGVLVVFVGFVVFGWVCFSRLGGLGGMVFVGWVGRLGLGVARLVVLGFR